MASDTRTERSTQDPQEWERSLRAALYLDAAERVAMIKASSPYLSNAEAEQVALFDVATKHLCMLHEQLTAVTRQLEEYRGVIETYGMIQMQKVFDDDVVRVALTIAAPVFVAATDPAELFVRALQDCIEQLRREHTTRHARTVARHT